MNIHVISWLIRGWCRAVSSSPSLPLSLSGNRGWVRLPLSLSPPLLVCLFLLSCAQPTDSTDHGAVERERIEVSGFITQDTVWESGKEYVVTGDVTVEAGGHVDDPAGRGGKVYPVRKSFILQSGDKNKK